MCLLIALLLLGPRAGLFLYWIAWPARWDAAFSTLIVPLLGVMVFPWTTLVYVLVAPGGIGAGAWFFLGLGFMLDVFSLSGSAGYGRRYGEQPAGGF
jgi:hypothetical protein